LLLGLRGRPLLLRLRGRPLLGLRALLLLRLLGKRKLRRACESERDSGADCDRGNAVHDLATRI